MIPYFKTNGGETISEKIMGVCHDLLKILIMPLGLSLWCYCFYISDGSTLSLFVSGLIGLVVIGVGAKLISIIEKNKAFISVSKQKTEQEEKQP